MIQAWNIHDGLSWNAPAWFVSAEFFLYLMCPILLLLMGARLGWRSLAVGVVSIVLLVALVKTSGSGLDIVYRNGTLRGLADFGIGLSLGVLFVASWKKDEGGKPLASGVHTLAQIGALAAVAAGPRAT